MATQELDTFLDNLSTEAPSSSEDETSPEYQIQKWRNMLKLIGSRIKFVKAVIYERKALKNYTSTNNDEDLQNAVDELQVRVMKKNLIESGWKTIIESSLIGELIIEDSLRPLKRRSRHYGDLREKILQLLGKQSEFHEKLKTVTKNRNERLLNVCEKIVELQNGLSKFKAALLEQETELKAEAEAANESSKRLRKKLEEKLAKINLMKMLRVNFLGMCGSINFIANPHWADDCIEVRHPLTLNNLYTKK